MSLSLVGLDPSVDREYVWLADDAVDRDASDIPRWIATGYGLSYDPARATVFRVRALNPTTLAIVHRHGLMGLAAESGPEPVDMRDVWLRNVPAIHRAAVAYAVVSATNSQELRRTADAGGTRLADNVLDALGRLVVEVNGVRVTLMAHLGELILEDSKPTEAEKKA